MRAINVILVSVCGAGIVSAALLGGCDQSTAKPAVRGVAPSGNGTGAAAPAGAASNTARNRPEQRSSDVTAMDQSNSAEAIRITAEIRRAVMTDAAMAMDAQNCKIITDAAGVVTLKGPVASAVERDGIQAKALAVAGVTKVVNELEIKTKE